ncbi:MAG: EamA family transporter [Gammaproteobacteria bacterium]|nr:EamA family transporter [Gammaproteobacteria bacterium]
MFVYGLIALALTLTTSGQILQKVAAHHALARGEGTHFILRILYVPQTYWAVACLVAGTVTWLAVLYYMDVSKATPFLSLGFILVTLVSRIRLHETISPRRWLGVLFVTVGLWLVAMT